MRAADETVAFLLSKGASPDLMVSNVTALSFAISSECSSTIDLLAPVTAKGLDESVLSLATFHIELTPAIEELLRRAASDKNAVRMGVTYATQFGATRMLKILTQDWDKNTLGKSSKKNPDILRSG